ncbi:MAG TPA: peptidoglycan-binding protein, partial [Gemmatimonadales bacterium]|nr:peptidoglycan-binding protein [Gemmatimonadales bacterium]
MRRFGVVLVLAGLAATTAAQESVDSAVVRFYAARWYQPAWVHANGISPQADELLGVVAQSARDGLDPADYLTAALDSLLHRHLSPEDARQLDSLLTRTFLIYAQDVSRGRVEPAAVDSQWTAARPAPDWAAFLDSALDARSIGAVLQDVAPPQPGYRALRAALARYRDMSRRGDWPSDLGWRLAAEGFASLRDFQRAHGLAADGIVGPETRAALDVSAAERVRQIELNLERWRWLPRSLGERYVLVNSAAFMLEAIDHDTVALSMRAVVGRLDWR